MLITDPLPFLYKQGWERETDKQTYIGVLWRPVYPLHYTKLLKAINNEINNSSSITNADPQTDTSHSADVQRYCSHSSKQMHDGRLKQTSTQSQHLYINVTHTHTVCLSLFTQFTVAFRKKIKIKYGAYLTKQHIHTHTTQSLFVKWNVQCSSCCNITWPSSSPPIIPLPLWDNTERETGGGGDTLDILIQRLWHVLTCSSTTTISFPHVSHS